MDYKNSLIIAILFIILAGCASTDVQKTQTSEIPMWVNAPPTSHDKIFGIGQARITGEQYIASQAAKESARLDIAKQLNVVISGNTQVKQEASNSSFTHKVSEVLTSKVPTIQLQGIKIEQETVSESLKTVFVLASFNRQEAIMHTELKISNLDDKILKVKLTQSEKLRLLKNAVQVQNLLAQRVKENAFLSYLQSEPIKRELEVEKQHDSSKQIINNIKFKLNIEGGSLELGNLISQSLSSQGLKIVHNNADFEVDLSVSSTSRAKDKTFYSFADSTVAVREGNNQIAHFSAKSKSASAYKDAAEDKSLERLGKKIGNKLAEVIIKGR